MVLNLLRVEEINPEFMLEKSFFQFQHYDAIPEMIQSLFGYTVATIYMTKLFLKSNLNQCWSLNKNFRRKITKKYVEEFPTLSCNNIWIR